MPPASKLFAVPKPGVPRPKLPYSHANPHVATSPYLPPARPAPVLTSFAVDASKPPTVKFQEIVREGQATIVRSTRFPNPLHRSPL